MREGILGGPGPAQPVAACMGVLHGAHDLAGRGVAGACVRPKCGPMPAPSQRRSSVRRSSASSSSKASQQKAATEEIEVEKPEGSEDSSVLNTAASGRSSSVRGSRRMRTASGRTSGASGSGKTSSRREKSPEDLAKRRQTIKSLLMVAIGVAVAVLVVAVLVLVVFKKDPLLEDASAKLAQVQSSLSTLDTRAEFEEAQKILKSVPDLPATAARKAELGKTLADIETHVAATERESRVASNRAALLAQLAKLTDPATELDKLAIDCAAFTKNPVDPTAAPNPDYVTEFSAAVNDIQVRLAQIETERGRRDTAGTTGAAQRVQLEVEGLVKEEKFAAALKLIDEGAVKFPKADFGRVRTFVTESAASNWTSVQGYVETRYADYAAPGITQSMRQKALEEARARLDRVIANWGIDSYVGQAKDLRGKY